MAEFNFAKEINDREAVADAILAVKEYNRQTPYPEMKISGEDMNRSHTQYMVRRAKLDRGIALQSDFVRLRADYAKAYGEIPEEDNPRSE